MAQKLALLSVFRKGGIVEFARGLIKLGFDIIASGGTFKHLTEAGVPAMDVAEWVGGEAILGHRVVTLSREIFAGILADDSPAHLEDLEKIGGRRIDLVCVDLYPLRDEILKKSSTYWSVMQKTDIGGPTLLRAAAKADRITVCDPSQYDIVLAELRVGMTDRMVRALGDRAEFVVAQYVIDSAMYRGGGRYHGLMGSDSRSLRYGENPHQLRAAHYIDERDDHRLGLHRFVFGQDPSFVNMTDLDRLVRMVVRIAAGFDANGKKVPCMAIAVKHGNPCGVGIGGGEAKAITGMISGDSEAIFGGSVLVNFELTEHWVNLLQSHQTEKKRPLDVVVAPSFTAAARKRLGRCKTFENPALAELNLEDLPVTLQFRQVLGGFLTQDPDRFVLPIKEEWELAEQKARDLIVAWGIGSTSTSNTIILVKDGVMIGRGLAEPSRVLACEHAVEYAARRGANPSGAPADLAVAYSDSFFPFIDGPKALWEAGVTTILATSGSKNDESVAAECSRMGVNLILLPNEQARGFFGH